MFTPRKLVPQYVLLKAYAFQLIQILKEAKVSGGLHRDILEGTRDGGMLAQLVDWRRRERRGGRMGCDGRVRDVAGAKAEWEQEVLHVILQLVQQREACGSGEADDNM